jgi:hypothetical protein
LTPTSWAAPAESNRILISVPITLAVDFGSTYTKLVAIDCDDELLVGTAQSPTTVADGVMIGLERALERLEASSGVKRRDIAHCVASSSAAGGLRMVAIGLVPDLTAEAARRAALGAGAKVLRVFAYELSRRDVEEIAQLAPDMILLSGGTDGGERKTIVGNASALAAMGLRVPVVVAGNRAAQDEVEAILRRGGLECAVVDNVLPELDRLNVEPARAAIRSISWNVSRMPRGWTRPRPSWAVSSCRRRWRCSKVPGCCQLATTAARGGIWSSSTSGAPPRMCTRSAAARLPRRHWFPAACRSLTPSARWKATWGSARTPPPLSTLQGSRVWWRGWEES